MYKKVPVFLVILIVCSSMLTLGCTSESESGSTSAQNPTATIAPGQPGNPAFNYSQTNGVNETRRQNYNDSFNGFNGTQRPGFNDSFNGFNGTQRPYNNSTWPGPGSPTDSQY